MKRAVVTGLSALDLAGVASLGVFVFSIPAFYMNQYVELQWLAQIFAALAVLTNLHKLSFRQIHSSMVCLAALYAFFSFTALIGTDESTQGSFIVSARFAAAALVLSLVVRERVQLLAVLGGLAVSAIFVAYASRGRIQATQEAVSQALMSSPGAILTRTAGVFGNENTLGVFAVSAMLAVVTLYFTTPRLITLVLCAPSAACAAYLAFFSGSRKAMIGMAMVVIFVSWLALKIMRKARLPVVLAALALAGGGIVWLYNNPYLSRFDTAEESYQVRIKLIVEALKLWQQHPLLGLGYDGFARLEPFGTYTHTTPSEMLCNGGLIALGLYAVFWWGFYITLRRCMAGRKEMGEAVLLNGVAALLLAEALSSITAVTIGEPRWLVLMGCLCGYLRSRELQMQGEPSRLRPFRGAAKNMPGYGRRARGPCPERGVGGQHPIFQETEPPKSAKDVVH